MQVWPVACWVAVQGCSRAAFWRGKERRFAQRQVSMHAMRAHLEQACLALLPPGHALQRGMLAGVRLVAGPALERRGGGREGP